MRLTPMMKTEDKEVKVRKDANPENQQKKEESHIKRIVKQRKRNQHGPHSL